ncbi:uncharacterized protein LOC134541209 [Bacillus rossius redtenbacheri]|uniref:uncharacterized protein LOC134541209 n=1 Tax=Bacillus rossius redtenbacheri TaxID=93214 RepID=UPI002FDDC746
MHAMGGIHSALAIKRQRKRRDEQRRARERRFSSQSTDSGLTASPRNSTGSLETLGRRRAGGGGGGRGAGGRKTSSGDDVGSKVVTSIGMLHIGVVFLVLGAFLTVSGLLPDDFSSFGKFSSGGWFNELVCTGLFALAIGLFLVVLNVIISKKEEDELNDYVQRQLTRSKSGHRLIRDVETGCLSTKQEQRSKMERRGSGGGHPEDERVDAEEEMDEPAPVHSPRSPTSLDGELLLVSPGHLEKILEEEASEKGEEESRAMDSFNKELVSNGSTTTSLSAGTPSETRELLSSGGQGRFFKMSRI